jgi:hypothetical protein
MKASYEDLAGSYQHLADKMTAWAAWIETERALLDATKSTLAGDQPSRAGPGTPSAPAKLVGEQRPGEARDHRHGVTGSQASRAV